MLIKKMECCNYLNISLEIQAILIEYGTFKKLNDSYLDKIIIFKSTILGLLFKNTHVRYYISFILSHGNSVNVILLSNIFPGKFYTGSFI